MKNKFIKVTCITNGLNAIAIGVMLGLLLVFHQRVSKLEQAVKTYEERQPVIIYQVDNADGLMTGKITDKEIIEGRYTVTAGVYGKFLVDKEQYEAIKVGDEMPEYLKGRGS